MIIIRIIPIISSMAITTMMKKTNCELKDNWAFVSVSERKNPSATARNKSLIIINEKWLPILDLLLLLVLLYLLQNCYLAKQCNFYGGLATKSFVMNVCARYCYCRNVAIADVFSSTAKQL
uniref:Uncharacterized protein n=1 Tax=Glossina pallidipes TaxID=7398 RepID=A0A1A9ZEZ3_GLOPL